MYDAHPSDMRTPDSHLQMFIDEVNGFLKAMEDFYVKIIAAGRKGLGLPPQGSWDTSPPPVSSDMRPPR